ncbi:tripartite tricarboxylate transporter permease [Aliifodinibius sp. S!AR15-10]|uniref:tripartite tricarboxylate transporter permease n=1 Tax=Aliifodinibius sp. S!AR15-10 TaxID=2950437 RepID=UPI002854EDD9|nr:tripartite tricarboxylate transporter permease [Aliifodinibius sp. S!AR15-10]MDR8391054.1 tripartite tricarboxylate transporter permease [Aliifodinibius sp. S!AR15-10]
MIEAIYEALQLVLFSPSIWLVILLSAVYGIFLGAIPGLTATMAVALFVPITYWMDPIPALAAIATMTACAIFAGDIPTTLLRIPGTPASAAYVDDAYAFTQRGEAGKALGAALTGSVFGGLFGAIILMLLGQQLARVATMFSVVEYFWLYLLGLSSAVVVSRGPVLKALLGLLIGLLLATVGLSAVHTEARFTFGFPQLYQGISFIPAMIGLFGLSEVIRNAINLGNQPSLDSLPDEKTDQSGRDTFFRRRIMNPILGVFKKPFELLASRKRDFFRSGIIGSVIGMLPGAGADMGSWISLAASKRSSSNPDQYGKGSLKGITDATTANNSALAGTWIPALVFGIPGDSITAIVIGVLLMKNLNPGPDIFIDQPVLVYSIYLAFILANIALLVVGYVAIKTGRFVFKIPQKVLLPLILIFCIIGSYAIQGSYFDVGIMLFMGFLGFVLERWEIPLGPVVLGIILGGPVEERFIQTLTGSEGIILPFFNRPIAAVLGVGFLILWIWTTWRNIKKSN